MALGSGNEWEMIFVLSGLYGLRRNEVLGLRWNNVDLKNKRFSVVEQLPFKVPPGTTTITEMAPTKSQDRILPITDVTLPFFVKQQQLSAYLRIPPTLRYQKERVPYTCQRKQKSPPAFLRLQSDNI